MRVTNRLDVGVQRVAMTEWLYCNHSARPVHISIPWFVWLVVPVHPLHILSLFLPPWGLSRSRQGRWPLSLALRLNQCQ